VPATGPLVGNGTPKSVLYVPLAFTETTWLLVKPGPISVNLIVPGKLDSPERVAWSLSKTVVCPVRLTLVGLFIVVSEGGVWLQATGAAASRAMHAEPASNTSFKVLLMRVGTHLPCRLR
jgi:hypothetical protein